MNILGIYDGHNCSAAVIRDGRIKAVVEEERLSRIKNHDGRFDGFPSNSVEKALEISGLEAGDIDYIAAALAHPLKSHRYYSNFFRDTVLRGEMHRLLYIKSFMQRERKLPTPIKELYGMGAAIMNPLVYQLRRYSSIKNFFREKGFDAPIKFIEHHACHAASAYFTSGRKDALVITSDGKGDGLSGSIYIGSNGSMERIKETDMVDSVGYAYSLVTTALGFKMNRHEGKITGLAAYGRPACTELYDFISADDMNISFTAARSTPVGPYPLLETEELNGKFARLAAKYSREDLSATIQDILEKAMTKVVGKAVEKTGLTELALAGGTFANVKLNQRLREINGVSSIFIHPAMGDNGLAVGAALQLHSQLSLDRGKSFLPFRLKDVYLGPGYKRDEIEKAMDRAKVLGERVESPGKTAGELVADRKVVAFFTGRCEYGPRALGDRSILYTPDDVSVNDWLNKRLSRTEFMPFAPVTLEERAEECYMDYAASAYAARFMTITYDCTEYMHKTQKGVIHVDGTARPQIINSRINREYYLALKKFEDITGLPSIINTSFNMHEEPIVCSPRDAIRSFKRGHLEYLMLGNYLIRNE